MFKLNFLKKTGNNSYSQKMALRNAGPSCSFGGGVSSGFSGLSGNTDDRYLNEREVKYLIKGNSIFARGVEKIKNEVDNFDLKLFKGKRELKNNSIINYFNNNKKIFSDIVEKELKYGNVYIAFHVKKSTNDIITSKVVDRSKVLISTRFKNVDEFETVILKNYLVDGEYKNISFGDYPVFVHDDDSKDFIVYLYLLRYSSDIDYSLYSKSPADDLFYDLYEKKVTAENIIKNQENGSTTSPIITMNEPGAKVRLADPYVMQNKMQHDDQKRNDNVDMASYTDKMLEANIKKKPFVITNTEVDVHQIKITGEEIISRQSMEYLDQKILRYFSIPLYPEFVSAMKYNNVIGAREELFEGAINPRLQQLIEMVLILMRYINPIYYGITYDLRFISINDDVAKEKTLSFLERLAPLEKDGLITSGIVMSEAKRLNILQDIEENEND